MARVKRTQDPELDLEMDEAMRIRLLELLALNAEHGGGHEFCPNDAVEQHFIPDL